MRAPHAKPRGAPLGGLRPARPDRSPVRPLAVAALAALALSACQEPAGVGLGLIDEEQSDPRVRTIPLTGLDTLQTPTVTLGFADPSPLNGASQPRVLAGAVVDPEFGDATAVAYVDFFREPGLVDGLEAADVLEAWVELDPGYVYGDTTTALPLELRPVQGSWDIDAPFPADTLFDVGDVLSTTTVTASDSLRRFDVPEAYLRANAGVFLSDTFGDDFEGFALQVPPGFQPSPGAVIGFGTFASQGAGLRLRTAEDTLVFELSEVFTSVDARPPAVAPTSFVPVRSSSRASLRFSADVASVGTTPLASARLYLPVDRSLLEAGTFVRPAPSRAFLFGVRVDDDGDEVRTALADLALTDDFVGVITDPRRFTQAVQQIVLGTEDDGFDFFEVLPDPSPVSLDVFPVLRPVEGGPQPARITLTLVGESL